MSSKRLIKREKISAHPTKSQKSLTDKNLSAKPLLRIALWETLLKEENNMRYLELYVFVVKRYKGLGKTGADKHPLRSGQINM